MSQDTSRPPASPSAGLFFGWREGLAIFGALGGIVALVALILQRKSRLPWVRLTVRPILRSLYDTHGRPEVMRYIPGVALSAVNKGDREGILRRLRSKPVIGKARLCGLRDDLFGVEPNVPTIRECNFPENGREMEPPRRDWKIAVGRFVAEDQYDRRFKTGIRVLRWSGLKETFARGDLPSRRLARILRKTNYP